MRLSIAPSSQNGLKVDSQLMIDKITTVAKVKLEKRVGRLASEDILRVNRAVLVFSGWPAPVPVEPRATRARPLDSYRDRWPRQVEASVEGRLRRIY